MSDKVPATCDLGDAHKGDSDGGFRVLPPLFRDFGRRLAFQGPVSTVRCFEDNSMLKAAVESPGQGRVLVVDGGGSLRRALLGGKLGAAAAENGWAGLVIDGAVRDVAELAACEVGIRALAPMPLPTERLGQGLRDVVLQIRGVVVRPGDWLIADADGIVLLPPGLKAMKPPVPEWEVVPSTPEQIEAVARECRRLVSKRALFAAGVAVVPIPALDWATNVGVLVKLLPDINRKFGLSAEQVERLAPDRRLVVFKAITAGGTMLVGRVVTRELVIAMLRMVGVRLSAQQAAKYVPLAGQGLSAVLTYGALRYVCEQHIRQCMAICEQLRLPAPTVVAP